MSEVYHMFSRNWSHLRDAGGSGVKAWIIHQVGHLMGGRFNGWGISMHTIN